MEVKDFFKFGSKLLSSTLQVHPIGLKEFHPIDPNKHYTYDEHRLILGDYSGISFPVVFKQEYGKKLQDMLDTGWAGLYLISNRMKTVFEENGLTGWKTFEVKVLTKKDEEVPGYHGLSVIGRCGQRDESKSEVIVKQFVPNGPLVKYYKGLHVGLDTWDGSDFFIEENTIGTIVTSKAAEALKKNKFTNVRLENLADMEIQA